MMDVRDIKPCATGALARWLFAVCVMAISLSAQSAVPIADEDKAYGALNGQIAERIRLWPGLAPHETESSPRRFATAQAHPEKYENLQVRVAGWNIRWNDIPRKEQDEYIRRIETVGE